MRRARVALFSWGFIGITAAVIAGCATDQEPAPRPTHGTIGEEKIMHAAQASSPLAMAREKLATLIREAGRVPETFCRTEVNSTYTS